MTDNDRWPNWRTYFGAVLLLAGLLILADVIHFPYTTMRWLGGAMWVFAGLTNLLMRTQTK